MKRLIWTGGTVFLVCIAAAQSLNQPVAVPMDQAVGDLDKLSRSLRQVELGLNVLGQQSSLFLIVPPQDSFSQPIYYRLGQGYRARFDRPDYLVRTGLRSVARNVGRGIDGQFIELIPPDTVFELQPLWPPGVGAVVSAETMEKALVSPPNPAAVDGRIDARIEARIDARVDGRLDSRMLPPQLLPEGETGPGGTR